MKKSLVIVVALVAILCGAQTAKGQIFKLGVKAGAIVSSEKLSIGGVQVSDTKPGFEIGIQTQVKIPVIGLFIQPEVTYSWVKTKFNGPNGLITSTTSQWDIPVMLGWKIAFFRIMAGPVFSFPSTSVSWGQADFSKYTTSYAVGLGFDLGKFTLDARYQGLFAPRRTETLIGGIPTGVELRGGRFNFALGYTLFKI